MSRFEEKQREHARRHEKQKRLVDQGVNFIEESRRGGMGRLLASLSDDHPLNRSKRAVARARARNQDDGKT